MMATDAERRREVGDFWKRLGLLYAGVGICVLEVPGWGEMRERAEGERRCVVG